MLDHHSTRRIAREALVAIGGPALTALSRAFEDATLPQQMRAHLPRSISRFQSTAATDILLERLECEPDGWVRFKIIRGLGQLRDHMRDPARQDRAFGLARKNLQQAVSFLSWQHDTQQDQAREPRLATVGGQLLYELLRDKSAHATDRAVRLVALMHSADASHNIRQALASQDERVRADGIELLIHGVPQDVAQALAAMLERGQDDRHLSLAAHALQLRPTAVNYGQRLSAMLADDSASLRAVVTYHMRELGLDEPASRQTDSLSSTGELSVVKDAGLGSVP
jgi:HEAT repeat protein